MFPRCVVLRVRLRVCMRLSPLRDLVRGALAANSSDAARCAHVGASVVRSPASYPLIHVFTNMYDNGWTCLISIDVDGFALHVWFAIPPHIHLFLYLNTCMTMCGPASHPLISMVIRSHHGRTLQSIRFEGLGFYLYS